ncbi:aspartyl-phosphate phosphatase Spo0E family protein [Paenibacillus periandrae]|uniref:aspartyl-phosphate phosphatase Spo0E family protein n=1 Tax=Paenibacillus periandrae TaxID=1761741 RepID=UPI003B831C79
MEIRIDDQFEDLRKQLHDAVIKFGLNSCYVLDLSQQLDVIHNMYNGQRNMA